jgi:hypothetical protein
LSFKPTANELTFFGNDVYDCILVNSFHGLHPALIYRRDDVDASDSPLAVGCSVKQGSLEMSVEFSIQPPIVTESDAESFVGVDSA